MKVNTKLLLLISGFLLIQNSCKLPETPALEISDIHIINKGKYFYQTINGWAFPAIPIDTTVIEVNEMQVVLDTVFYLCDIYQLSKRDSKGIPEKIPFRIIKSKNIIKIDFGVDYLANESPAMNNFIFDFPAVEKKNYTDGVNNEFDYLIKFEPTLGKYSLDGKDYNDGWHASCRSRGEYPKGELNYNLTLVLSSRFFITEIDYNVFYNYYNGGRISRLYKIEQ